LIKKFGTPNGAGPGSANENVGFAAVGTPFLDTGANGLAADVVVVVVVGVVAFVPVPFVSFPPGPVAPDGLRTGFLPFPGDVDGGGCDDVAVVGLVEVVDVVTLGTGELLADGAHAADTLRTGGVPGGTNDEAGVPGAALTVNTNV
jgi:hypothetical protein